MDDQGAAHLALSSPGEEERTIGEIRTAGLRPALLEPGVVGATGSADSRAVLPSCRQWLPDAVPASYPSIRSWAKRIADEIDRTLDRNLPWLLHVFPPPSSLPVENVGARAAHTARTTKGAHSPAVITGKAPPSRRSGPGPRRCELIRETVLELLGGRHRAWRASLRNDPSLGINTSFVQVLLTGQEHGWISVSRAPQPHEMRRLMVPFSGGNLPVSIDKNAPSRAFAKLVEAEMRFGRRIQPGELCVDLGASPGGWTWVARQRGARVVAVDRSPLREDLMNDPMVSFVRGDAFSYEPKRPVDWLVCDVIAAPERSIELVLEWARRRWMRHFVVTIKLRIGDHPKLDRLKTELPAWSDDWYLTHLCANKHEACVFGSVRDTDPITA